MGVWLFWLVAFSGAVWLGRLTVSDASVVALVRPASGVAAFWFISRRDGRWIVGDWVLLALANLVVCVVTGLDPVLAVALTGVGLVQVAMVLVAVDMLAAPGSFVYLDGKWAHRTLDGLDSLGRLLATFAIAAAVSTAVAVPVFEDVSGLTLGRDGLVLWFVRALTGLAVPSLGVLGLIKTLPTIDTDRAPRRVELLTLTVVTLGLLVWVAAASPAPVAFLVLVPVLWGASRFSIRVATAQSLITAVVVVTTTLVGRGPFTLIDDPLQRATVAQLCVLTLCLSSMLVAILRLERDDLLLDLAAQRDRARLAQESWRTVFDQITEGAAVVGVGGVILSRNEAGRRLFGATDPTTPLPDTFDPIAYGLRHIDGSVVRREEMPACQALTGVEICPIEFLVQNPLMPEPRILRFNAALLPGEDRRAISVYSDVTDEVRQREGLSAYAGTVAHDLKNPLSSVLGWSDYLADQAASWDQGDERQKIILDSLTRVRRAATDANHLVGGLLANAQADAHTLERRPLDLQRIVTALAARYEHLGAEAPQITYEGDPSVVADELLLTQVMDNLLGNAVKYTPVGQRPHIVVSTQTDQRGAATITVTDRGVGIPSEACERVFTAHYRVPGTHASGVGLGLAMCRRTIERHGGTITASQGPHDTGTRITFTLPNAASPTVVRADWDHQPRLRAL